MRIREDLTFTHDEYERRLQGLRTRMADRHLEVVIISDPENLFYLTGYQTTGYSYFQALVVPLEGEPFMVTRLLEESNVIARTWVELTRPFTDTGDAIETLWHAMVEFGLNDKVIGYERNSYFFPAYLQDRMLATIVKGDLRDCFGIVEEGRITKSDEELSVMRRAAAAGQEGLLAGIAACQVGATENDIAAEIHHKMFRAGGEYPAVAPYVVSGPRCLIGHATWEGRKVEQGDLVFLEVAGCYRRYHAAMMRTVCVGEPDAAIQGAEAIVLEARQALLDQIRAGITASDVDHICREVIAHSQVGGTLVTRAGYSIGIAFAPSWDEGYILSLKPGNNQPLQPNTTLHLIPWLWDFDGRRVMGISETIVVTEDGNECLFDVPPQLFIN